MIKVSNLIKSFDNGEERLRAVNNVSFEITDNVRAVNNVSFEITDNDFVVIVGASGSGKSTLLNAISGLDKPDSGSVFYDDIDICTLSDKELTKFRKEKTAFVFQGYYLLPSLNVSANIKMGANLAGKTDFSDIVEAVGLKGKENKLPHQLSGGEQQRVSIARALAKEPTVLFCDEPTGALDEQTGRQILKYLISLQKERRFCIVMVTHNQNFTDIATKVIRMNSGKIIEIKQNENPLDVDSIGW